MKLAVIGARGFLGQALSLRLAQSGQQVTAISRTWDGFDRATFPDGVTLFDADAIDDVRLRTGLRSCSAVYYLAYDGVPLSDSVNFLAEYRANLDMLSASMAAAEMAGCERFVFVSSGGTVYGDAEEDPISETAPLKPISHYGNIKRLSESLVHSYCALTRSFRPVVARVANPFGAGQISAKRKGLIVATMLRIARDEPVSVFDGGTQVRDYLHIDDATEALATLARAAGVIGETVNVSSGVGRDVLSVIESIERVSGRCARRLEEAGRSQDVLRNVLSREKLRRLTGWEPRQSFEQALAHTWEAVAREA